MCCTGMPKTLDEAVDFLTENENAKIIKEFKSRETFVNAFHHSTGRWIRNNWITWSKPSCLQTELARNYGLVHPDDMSSIILDCVWAKAHGAERRIEEMAEHCEKHWKWFGDPGWDPQGEHHA